MKKGKLINMKCQMISSSIKYFIIATSQKRQDLKLELLKEILRNFDVPNFTAIIKWVSHKVCLYHEYQLFLYFCFRFMYFHNKY